jgi:hypothetical protein
MFRCEATTATGEHLTLYGHFSRPEDALRMVLKCWRHDGVAETTDFTPGFSARSVSIRAICLVAKDMIPSRLCGQKVQRCRAVRKR